MKTESWTHQFQANGSKQIIYASGWLPPAWVCPSLKQWLYCSRANNELARYTGPYLVIRGMSSVLLSVHQYLFLHFCWPSSFWVSHHLTNIMYNNSTGPCTKWATTSMACHVCLDLCKDTSTQMQHNDKLKFNIKTDHPHAKMSSNLTLNHVTRKSSCICII